MAEQYRPNPSWEWQAHDRTIIKLDYVWATKQFHVWWQPPGDNQAYWIGQTADPIDAEVLLKGLLRSWGESSTAAIRGAIESIRSQIARAGRVA